MGLTAVCLAEKNVLPLELERGGAVAVELQHGHLDLAGVAVTERRRHGLEPVAERGSTLIQRPAQHSLGDLVGLRRVIDPRVVLKVFELQALLLEVLVSDGALEDILTVADRKLRLRRRGKE